MIRVAAFALGIAVLLVLFLARPQEPATARVEPAAPAVRKGDRLAAPAALVAPPAPAIVGAPVPADAPVATPTAAPAALVAPARSAMVAAAPAAPALVATAARPDPVCGAKGRTVYFKHGWQYWRCNR